MTTLPDIDPEEVKTAIFDFNPELEASETLTSVTVTATTASGDDDQPGLVLVGAPLIVGREVLHRIRGRNDQTIYALRARGEGNEGLVHVVKAMLPCKA